MMDVIELLETVESHGVRLLGDGGVDQSTLHQVQRGLIRVHGDDQAVGGVVALHRFGNDLAGRSLKTDKRTDVFPSFCGEPMLSAVKWVPRIALDVEDFVFFDDRATAEIYPLSLHAALPI